MSGGCGTVFELIQLANGKWNETVLHSFENDDRDGDGPNGGLVFDGASKLSGTTTFGGAHHYGSAFEMVRKSSGWDEHVIYSFPLPGGWCCPEAGLTTDRVGNLYGTANAVFELSSTPRRWKARVLHSFTAHNDGATPAGLIFDMSGNLYGTTEAGGIGCGSEGCGIAYEMQHTQSGWKEIVLHRFNNNGRDGYTPGNGSLFMDRSGRLYGTTEVGGTAQWGTVFRLTRASDGHWKETILFNFKNGPGGGFPAAGVVMDKAGNLYGTTVDGGTSCDCGVVYKLAPDAKGKWTYTVLHRFSNIDGAVPAGNLTLDDKGNLYGGTVLGGTTGNGVIFELTP